VLHKVVASLGEQLLDDMLQARIIALSEMVMTDAALGIDKVLSKLVIVV
jgi:hypothetical protein